MSALADSLKALVGTAPFRQAAIMVASSVVIGGLVVFLLHQMTSEIIARQAAETLRAEAASLGSIARIGGPAALAEAAAERAGNLGGRLHLIEDATGRRIAGTLQRWPAELDGAAGSGVFRYPGQDGERLAAGIVVPLGRRRAHPRRRATWRSSVISPAACAGCSSPRSARSRWPGSPAACSPAARR